MEDSYSIPPDGEVTGFLLLCLFALSSLFEKKNPNRDLYLNNCKHKQQSFAQSLNSWSVTGAVKV